MTDRSLFNLISPSFRSFQQHSCKQAYKKLLLLFEALHLLAASGKHKTPICNISYLPRFSTEHNKVYKNESLNCWRNCGKTTHFTGLPQPNCILETVILPGILDNRDPYSSRQGTGYPQPRNRQIPILPKASSNPYSFSSTEHYC